MPSLNKDIESDLDINGVELRTLGDEWQTGKLQALSGYLLDFVDRHRMEILKMARHSKSPDKLVEAARRFVRKRGYIHLPLDMADQIHEINNEIWYQGEKGDFNRQKIKENWTLMHAADWRKWRVKQILYIIDRRASEVAAHLLR